MLKADCRTGLLAERSELELIALLDGLLSGLELRVGVVGTSVRIMGGDVKSLVSSRNLKMNPDLETR